jgi:hypothetical protein
MGSGTCLWGMVRDWILGRGPERLGTDFRKDGPVVESGDGSRRLLELSA